MAPAPGILTVRVVPELPEVENVRVQLAALLGWRVTRAWAASWPRFASAAGASGTILSVRRRGKYLLLNLDDATLVLHLGMTGVVRAEPGHAPVPPTEQERHVHVRLHLEDPEGTPATLSLADPRRFGRAVLLDAGEALPEAIESLGPEPFPGELTRDHLRRTCAATSRAIKAVLLDQRVVAGVGNIYADEALFAAGIHPCAPASVLSSRRVDALCDAVIGAVEQGLLAGGTTLRDYRRPDGSSGTNQDNLQAYGRDALPCLRCGTTMESVVVAGRTSVFCPECQRR